MDEWKIDLKESFIDMFLRNLKFSKTFNFFRKEISIACCLYNGKVEVNIRLKEHLIF
jgi:hypothetical protein